MEDDMMRDMMGDMMDIMEELITKHLLGKTKIDGGDGGR